MSATDTIQISTIPGAANFAGWSARAVTACTVAGLPVRTITVSIDGHVSISVHQHPGASVRQAKAAARAFGITHPITRTRRMSDGTPYAIVVGRTTDQGDLDIYCLPPN